MIHVQESDASMGGVIERLEKASAENGFAVLGVLDLKEKLAAQEAGPTCQCHIMEVCNPEKARAVLHENMSISTVLPCRISIYREAGKIKVATLRPTMLLNLFDSPELQAVARDLEDTLVRIIDTACTKRGE
jgi:uncharacterized protein (DUF302 family)